jgi:hypothetical protein
MPRGLHRDRFPNKVGLNFDGVYIAILFSL